MSGLRSFQDSWLQHPVEALILVLALPPSSQEAVNRDEVWIGRRVARGGGGGVRVVVGAQREAQRPVGAEHHHAVGVGAEHHRHLSLIHI